MRKDQNNSGMGQKQFSKSNLVDKENSSVFDSPDKSIMSTMNFSSSRNNLLIQQSYEVLGSYSNFTPSKKKSLTLNLEPIPNSSPKTNNEDKFNSFMADFTAKLKLKKKKEIDTSKSRKVLNESDSRSRMLCDRSINLYKSYAN